MASDDGVPGEGWRGEASAVIQDVSSFVHSMSISEKLPCDESGIYFNLETKESKRYTIELSTAGFRISGHSFDVLDDHDSADGNDVKSSRSFETIYALLDAISPAYRESFSTSLARKLSQLLPSGQETE